MKLVSFSSILTLVFILYVGNTIWNLIEIFIPPDCAKGSKRCYSSYLSSKPVQNLIVFSSALERPQPEEATKIYTSLNFDYGKESTFDVNVKLPQKTRNNGTFFLHLSLVDDGKLYYNIRDLMRTEPFQTIPLVTFMEPKAATFNLLNQDGEKKMKNIKAVRPTAHISTEAAFSIFTDDIRIAYEKIPPEIYQHFRLSTNNRHYMPIIINNILKTRLMNMVEVTKATSNVNVTVKYSPISFGSLRLILHVKLAMQNLQTLGFGPKDIDDVKGIFADTNVYFLSATVFIASFHLLFDFLAFKNDVSFWRSKKSMVGLSTRTILWRAFSQCVILLFLFDQSTSLIVLIPASISVFIELWKVKKVLHIKINWYSIIPTFSLDAEEDKAELKTRNADAEAMRYLSYLLYPLCITGAVYSLIYEPQKSWYSWCLNSTVNGVYAFGFLFMLPQLFVNYRLKSVAALPLRAFMYKAVNTFIDDIFAFIITMPTAHRVACFRDDIVFVIYLYQRWLYPVDKSRTDESTSIAETPIESSKKED